MTTTMINKIQLLLLTFIIILLRPLSAQHVDGGGWVNAGISFEIINDLSCDIAEEIRYNFSTGDLYQMNSNISVDYKINKRFKLGSEYRYSIRKSQNTNRIAASFGYKEEMNDLTLSLRSKFQYSFTPDASEGTAFRNKLGAKYKINKDFSPFITGEIFYSMSNEINQFDNFRTEGGLSYGPNKHNEFNLSYIYDKEFNVNKPETMHIVSLSYVYTF